MSQTDEGLLKLIDIQSFYDEEDLGVHIIDPNNTDELVKTAADTSIQRYIEDDLAIRPGKMYLHINAMGAGEYYGSNKNGDYFPEENLKRYYKTFEENGHVFRHHINKDPKKSIGKVIYATYNDRMHRVELIAEVDAELGKDVEENIARGKYPFTSMACKTPFDLCSICKKKARSRAEYCQHLKQQLNQIYTDGRRVMSLNVGPLRFFDISIVIRPADSTSSVLQKVAEEAGQPAVSSVELAEAEEVQDRGHSKKASVKQAALNKLSTMVKKVEGNNVMDVDEDVDEIMEKIKSPDKALIKTLSTFPLEEVFNAFAELGSAPTIQFLAELIAHYHIGEQAEGLGEKAEVILWTTHPSNIPDDSIDLLGDLESKPANPILVRILRENSDASFLPKEIQKRASETYGGFLGHNQNAQDLPMYVNMSKEEVDQERNRVAEEMAAKASNKNPLTTLLTLGGAALLARYYVSSMMDKKIEEAQLRQAPMQQSPTQYAKIGNDDEAQQASRLMDQSTSNFVKKAKESGLF